jgi:CMD domain protein
MPETTTDVIDTLSGIAPGSRLDTLRQRRPITRDYAQKSYKALFEPYGVEDVSPAERFAVAVFVSGLHGQKETAQFYAEKLRDVTGGAAIEEAVAAAREQGAASGPFGSYPAGPLEVENTEGLVYRLPPALAQSLGRRLTSALEHAHLLVFHPRDARSADIGRLLQSGWSANGVVTLSQLVAFLAFQTRVVTGLRALAAA